MKIQYLGAACYTESVSQEILLGESIHKDKGTLEEIALFNVAKLYYLSNLEGEAF